MSYRHIGRDFSQRNICAPGHEISFEEQIAELKRELAMRRRLYPQWIKDGRIQRATAELRISRLDAALETIETVAAATRPAELLRDGLAR